MLDLSPGITMYILTIVFLLGAVFASFLTCMGWRIVKGESVLEGRSHCDSCGHPLGWRDLIPIFSYFARRGRCAYCGQPISIFSTVGEILLAVVFVLTTIRFDVSWELVLMLFFVCILYFVSVTDIYDQVIPNGAIITALVVRVIWHGVFELFVSDSPDLMVTVGFLIDGLAVSLPLFFLVLLMEKLWKKEAMGGGDIKLLFIVGLYLGWEKTLLTLLFACIVGIIGGTIQLRRQEGGYFAFGPYIAIAAVLSLLIGDGLIGWYLSLF